jgi:periplasmic protein TonB
MPHSAGKDSLLEYEAEKILGEISMRKKITLGTLLLCGSGLVMAEALTEAKSVSDALSTSATEPVAPPSPESVIEAPLAPGPVAEALPKPAPPLMMSLELSLACSQRTPPSYPAVSRRLGEQGQVKLQVELDETGRITFARVAESSGHKRLDEAGLVAVKSWQCNPSTHNGVAVRAVALQPFVFILEGR